MNLGFWDTLPKPFWVLAPMEDVTDTVFRQIVAGVGRPHVFFTEFTNVKGLLSVGQSEVIKRFQYSQAERPIVAQIWGIDPKDFFEAARLIKQLKFDGIDINFGCPERNIAKQGGCSALIGQNRQVGEIIAATQEGGQGLPVSVKTRLGQKVIITEDWVGFLLTQNLAAITLHGRTAAELSLVPAHWDEIAKAVELRNHQQVATLIIGNGDVVNLSQARGYVQTVGVDGVMIGRGIFSNVGLFAEKVLTQEQKMALFEKHIRLFETQWGKSKNFQILKKFVKTYVEGFEGASQVREQLMESQTTNELLHSVQKFAKISK